MVHPAHRKEEKTSKFRGTWWSELYTKGKVGCEPEFIKGIVVHFGQYAYSLFKREFDEKSYLCGKYEAAARKHLA